MLDYRIDLLDDLSASRFIWFGRQWDTNRWRSWRNSLLSQIYFRLPEPKTISLSEQFKQTIRLPVIGFSPLGAFFCYLAPHLGPPSSISWDFFQGAWSAVICWTDPTDSKSFFVFFSRKMFSLFGDQGTCFTWFVHFLRILTQQIRWVLIELSRINSS